MTIRGMEETMERLTKRTDDGKVVYALLRPGTCVNPIDLLKAWGDRLAAYEDTGLDPKEVAELVNPKTVEIVRLLEKMCTEGSAQHMLELFQAEKDGRLVVLPPVSEDDNAFQGNLDVFELSLTIKWAHAAALMDEKPEVSRLFLLSEIALNEKLERLVKGRSPNAPLFREDAEAALKKEGGGGQ